MKRRAVISVPVALTVFAALIIAAGGYSGSLNSHTLSEQSAAVAPGTAKVVFVVHCYDVGKAALEGGNGVKRVTKGFMGFREVNTVIYDPKKTSVGELEEALKKAGTYVETVR